jgi:tRNA (cmo5U34)-methyltransferase
VSSSSLNRFNALAGVYDTLVELVFGNSVRQAQRHYLKEIPTASNVLILGGGTGWIIRELLLVNPTATIWYVEASSAMIERSKKKMLHFPGSTVHFIHGTEDSIPEVATFNVVITAFFLDLFTPSSLVCVIEKIKKSLVPDAMWLATDFVNQANRWQGVMLRVMYFFFRFVCRIEAKQLPQWEKLLRHYGYKEIKSHYFFYSFIKTAVLSLNQ